MSFAYRRYLWYALSIVRTCEDHHEYPLTCVRQQAIVNCINKYRAEIEKTLRRARADDDAAICQLQDILNRIPLYLSRDMTLELHKCRRIIK
jgi:hypothetical protein